MAEPVGCCSETGITGSFAPDTVVLEIIDDTTFRVSQAPTSTIKCGAVIKGTLFGRYTSGYGAYYDAYGSKMVVDTTFKLYPGMAIRVSSGTGSLPSNTYVTNVLSDTEFTISELPDAEFGSDAILIGIPQIYVTEYAIQQSSGPVADISAIAQSGKVALTANIISDGEWPRHTEITYDRRLIELLNKNNLTISSEWTTTNPNDGG